MVLICIQFHLAVCAKTVKVIAVLGRHFQEVSNGLRTLLKFMGFFNTVSLGQHGRKGVLLVLEVK